MDTKIKKLLEASSIKYKLIEHRKVYTAFNEAETQHIDPKAVVKTVFVKLSKSASVLLDNKNTAISDGVLVCVPAGKRVDIKKIAKALNQAQEKAYKTLVKANPKVKKPASVAAKLANEKDIIKKLKTKIGLLSPLGQIYGLPVLLDKKLAKNKKLVISAASYTESLEITLKDFTKITPILSGNFTE